MAESDCISVGKKGNIVSCISCGSVIVQKHSHHWCCSKPCRYAIQKDRTIKHPANKRGSVVDRTGQKFGRLTVIKDVGRKFGGVLWRCRCECGKYVDVRASSLVCGDSKSCSGHGECHHAWKGGVKNKGSLAWALQKLKGLTIKSEARGHSSPVQDANAVIEAWKECDGVCVVCKKECVLCLDHCHTTGVIRGFICSSCNHILGLAEDNTERLRNLIAYLSRYAKS